MLERIASWLMGMGVALIFFYVYLKVQDYKMSDKYLDKKWREK